MLAILAARRPRPSCDNVTCGELWLGTSLRSRRPSCSAGSTLKADRRRFRYGRYHEGGQGKSWLWISLGHCLKLIGVPLSSLCVLIASPGGLSLLLSSELRYPMW